MIAPMKRIILGLLVVLLAPLALAEPAVVTMAKEEKILSTALLRTLGSLNRNEIDAARDAEGRGILHWLAVRSHQARALLVLLAGADANVRDIRGRTPLFDVIEANDPVWKGQSDFMLMEMLVMRGADVNARSKDGLTPLALAVERNDFRKVDFLIWRGATINPSGVAPETSPWGMALAKNNERMKAMLAAALELETASGARGAISREVAPKERIAQAVTAADLNGIINLLDSGWNIDAQNEDGQTALYQAVATGRPDLVSLLLFEGADPDIADKDGRTPLMLGSRLLSIEGQRMTAMLLLKGTNVHAANKAGETALIIAATAGHEIGVIWLIAAGADPLAATPKGSLMEYVTHGRTTSVLKEFGVAAKSKEPATTTKPPIAGMFEAAARGDVAEVERHLQSGIPVDAMYDKERTALVWAAHSGQFEVVDLLLRYGAKINRQYPSNGLHVLHQLVKWPRPPGNEPNVGAASIKKLIQRGASPDLQMKDGTTPLMIAAKAGLTEAPTRALLEGGADLNLRNKEGLTALGIAKMRGHNEFADLVKERGGIE
jgi:ankyrin repeat protein